MNRFFNFFLLGFGIGLVEWVVMNVMHVFGVIHVSVIISTIILVRRRFVHAVAMGMGAQFVLDVMSFSMVPFRMLSLLVLFALVHVLFNHFFSHRGLLGFGLAGLAIFVGMRLVYVVYMIVVRGLSFGQSSMLFPNFFLDVFVNVVLYMSIVLFLYRRWKVLHIQWPRGV